MRSLKQYHFFYGAILNSIFEFNRDASPTLLEATEKRGIYKIITNTSKKEYIAFCKYAFQQENKSDAYQSWKFAFSDEDKIILQKYYDKNYPIFIYFLCGSKGLKNSEIAICSYEEYSVVKEKQTITIGREKHKSYFNLNIEKSRGSSIHLKRSRIEQKIDDIIEEIINFSPEHYKAKIKQNIKINLPETTVGKKQYTKAISGQNVRYLSLSYRDDDICPIHNEKMPPIYVHIGNLKDTAYYCKRCGKYMIPANRYERLMKNLGKTAKDIEFEAIIK